MVVPNWNGRRWLSGCLGSLAAQTQAAQEIVVVDNGSTDGSRELIARDHPDVRLLTLSHNTGFAHAVNLGIEAVRADAVALVNTDVVLERDWLELMTRALRRDRRIGSVACKMLDLADPTRLYDAGDVLRRDGVCEQRGRFERDDGRFDAPGEVFAACAGAGLYRRDAVRAVGAFDERFFAYLEDVDLGLRLRMAGWHCRYEPAVARHAGGGSSDQLARTVDAWVERNTLLLVAKAFPLRWLPQVAYRQAAWAWHALCERRLRAHLAGAGAAVALVPAMWRERRRLRATATTAVEVVVPARPIRAARRVPSRRPAGDRDAQRCR